MSVPDPSSSGTRAQRLFDRVGHPFAAYERTRHTSFFRKLAAGRLELDVARVDREAMEMIAAFMVRLAPRIREVALSDAYTLTGKVRVHNHPTRADIRRKLGRALVRTLERASRLESLELHGMRLDAKQWRGVAAAVRGKRALEQCLLRDCNIRDAGFARLASALGDLEVARVRASACFLGPASGAALARVIKRHAVRRDTQMWQLGLRGRASEPSSRGVTSVDVSLNRLGHEGVAELVDAMCQDSWVLALDVRQNGVDGRTVAAMDEMLRRNETLLRLTLLPVDPYTPPPDAPEVTTRESAGRVQRQLDDRRRAATDRAAAEAAAADAGAAARDGSPPRRIRTSQLLRLEKRLAARQLAADGLPPGVLLPLVDLELTKSRTAAAYAEARQRRSQQRSRALTGSPVVSPRTRMAAAAAEGRRRKMPPSLMAEHAAAIRERADDMERAAAGEAARPRSKATTKRKKKNKKKARAKQGRGRRPSRSLPASPAEDPRVTELGAVVGRLNRELESRWRREERLEEENEDLRRRVELLERERQPPSAARPALPPPAAAGRAAAAVEAAEDEEEEKQALGGLEGARELQSLTRYLEDAFQRLSLQLDSLEGSGRLAPK